MTLSCPGVVNAQQPAARRRNLQTYCVPATPRWVERDAASLDMRDAKPRKSICADRELPTERSEPEIDESRRRRRSTGRAKKVIPYRKNSTSLEL